jgi:hypothetical protein
MCKALMKAFTQQSFDPVTAVGQNIVMAIFRILNCAALALIPSLALAHHGQDFLLVESPTVPHSGSVYLIANGHAALSNALDERASFEPALLFGITSRIAFEMHAHTDKMAGDHWAFEAIAPSVHLLLTDPEKHEGYKLGVSAEYEIAARRGDPDNAEVRLSLEHGDDENKWTANLIASKEQGSDADVGAALGFRREIREGIALGVEGQSSFQRADGALLLATAYFENEKAGTFKLGLGGERTGDGRCEPVLHLGLVLHIK